MQAQALTAPVEQPQVITEATEADPRPICDCCGKGLRVLVVQPNQDRLCRSCIGWLAKEAQG